MKKIYISIIIAVALIFLGQTKVMAADYSVNSGEDFISALNDIHTHSNSSFSIELTDDITINANVPAVDNGNTVTIIGKESERTILFAYDGNNEGTKLNVSNGTINLGEANSNGNLVLKGTATISHSALVFVTNGTVNMYDGVTLTKNHSGGGHLTGGGVKLSTNGIFNMYGGKITDNRIEDTEFGGGAVFSDASGAKFNMTGGEISNNYGVCYGGAICIMNPGAEVDINNGTIKNNSSGGMGGMILALYGNKFKIKNSTIENNSALYGGAICTYCDMELSGNIFKNNTAGTDDDAGFGGAMYIGEGIIKSSNDTFTGNKSTWVGGGICIDENAAGGDFETSFVYNNKADTDANDFYIETNAGPVKIMNPDNMSGKKVEFDGNTVSIDGWYADTSEKRFKLEDPTDEIVYNSLVTGQGYSITAATSSICIVTFDTNGGSTINKQVITKGDNAIKPNNPAKSGFKFDGWYTDSDLTKKFDFSTPIEVDTTLYAKWTSSEDDSEDPQDEEDNDATESDTENKNENISEDKNTNKGTNNEESKVIKTYDSGILKWCIAIIVSLIVIQIMKKKLKIKSKHRR